MNKRHSHADLQLYAAGLIGFQLLHVRTLKDVTRDLVTDRYFIGTESYMILVSSGYNGGMVVDGHYRLLRPGSFFVCAPGQLVELSRHSGLETGLWLFYFQVRTLSGNNGDTVAQESSQGDLFPFLGEAVISPSSQIIQIAERIGSNWNDQLPSSRLRCEAGLLELLSYALSYREQQMALAMESARMELERNYRNDITIDGLAGIAGLSRYHFMRIFKEHYGKGVMEYRTDLRLREAKRLMENPAYTSLSSIAHQVGYKNETYFSSLFKKQTGIAPAVYQRNQKRRIAAYSWVNLGQLLALQTIPFASPIDHYWTDYYRSKYSDEVKVPLSHQYDFNRKALREAKPDYIIGIDGFVPPEEQEDLHRIAPSLFLPWEEDWRTHLLLVAEFIDRTEEAVKWLSRYDRKATSTRELIAPFIRKDKLLVLAVSGDEVHAWGNRAGSAFYDDLRIGMPVRLADFSWKERVEPHELHEFGADRILVQVDGDATSRKTWNQLSRKEDWLKLEAVHNRKLNFVTDYPGFQAPWNEYSADNRDRFLNEIPALFGIGGSRR